MNYSTNYTEEVKNEMISSEIKRINKLFSGIDLKTRKALEPLIRNAAFLAVIIQDLQITIIREGVTEEYQNGLNQAGEKESSVVKVHNTMTKNHSQIMGQLAGLLPKPKPGGPGPEPENPLPEFGKFLGRR